MRSNVLLFWLIFGIYVKAEDSQHQRIVNKCCKPELHQCCLQSLQTNSSLQCTGKNWRETTKCIEVELFSKSLLNSGADYCCALLSGNCRINCIETMRKAPIPIDHRLKLANNCEFLKEEDKPDCYNDTIRRFHGCFSECVAWHRENLPTKKFAYNAREQCDFFRDKRVIYHCLSAE